MCRGVAARVERRNTAEGSSVSAAAEQWAGAGNGPDDEQEDRPLRRLSFEETIDERRNRKSLVDCSLPDGFELVTPRPRQMVVDGLLIWSFMLKFEPWNGPDRSPLYHVARYEMRVPDDYQMRWALTDFTRDLVDEGYDVGDAIGFAPSGVARDARVLHELMLKTESKLAGKIKGNGVYFGREMLRCPAKRHAQRVAA